MKKPHTKSVGLGAGHGNGVEINELLKKIEKILDRTRSLAWISYKKLESIDESIAIFAAQKKVEITPETTEVSQVE